MSGSKSSGAGVMRNGVAGGCDRVGSVQLAGVSGAVLFGSVCVVEVAAAPPVLLRGVPPVWGVVRTKPFTATAPSGGA